MVDAFRVWANQEAGVRAAIIVGSQARSEVPADEWSDLDLVIFHTEPARLIEATDWFQSFGTVLVSEIERTAVGGSLERRVLYSDGRDVDFAVFPTAAIPVLTRSEEGRSVLGRGFIVLVDKDGQLAKLAADRRGERPEATRPASEAAFEADVSDFLYHVLWAAKKLRRGETWIAKMVCDGYLKLLLLRMVEWNTVLRELNKVDVWHDGRFLDSWAPPDIRARLTATFARYDVRDVARALWETASLYTDLARQVAEKLGWAYPLEAEAAVQKLMERTLASLPKTP